MCLGAIVGIIGLKKKMRCCHNKLSFTIPSRQSFRSPIFHLLQQIQYPSMASIADTTSVAYSDRKVALITGITGQDGSYLTELLLEKGYTVSPIGAHGEGTDWYCLQRDMRVYILAFSCMHLTSSLVIPPAPIIIS